MLFQRYVFRQLLFPTAASIALLATLLLVGRLVKILSLLINRGLGIQEVIYLLILMVPSFLEFALPMGVMLGTFVTLGRLTTDGEITGAQACGLGTGSFLPPLILLGSIAALGTAAVSLALRPYSREVAASYLAAISLRRATAALQEQVFFDQIPGLLIYTERIENRGRVLSGVFLADQRTPGKLTTIASSKGYLLSGSSPSEHATILRLQDGVVFSWKDLTDAYELTTFETLDWNLSETLDQSSVARSVTALDQRAARTGILISGLRSGMKTGLTAAEVAFELSSRIALPLSCILFVTLALALSFRWHLSVTAGVALSSLSFVAYYVLSGFGEALVHRGASWPWAAAAAWFPNVGLTMGCLLIWPNILSSKASRNLSIHELRELPLTEQRDPAAPRNLP